jgi:hypothetical protein
MTDSEVTGHNPADPPAPATPWTPPPPWSPPAAQDAITAGGPTLAQAPVVHRPVVQPAAVQPPAVQPGDTTAPRRRRRWLWAVLASLVVIGLAAGLVVWAPWVPPPVLRPARLVAGPATATSVSLRWARPASGPLPDKYLVFSNGMLAAAVAGTATSYQQTGLTPATGYQLRVVAVRGGKRSPQSSPLSVRTVTPPVSQGRMQGSWLVTVKLTQGPLSRRHWGYAWVATPACAAGACDTKLRVGAGRHAFTLKLTRAGAGYQAQVTLPNFIRCGTAGNFVWDPALMRFRLHVTAATGQSTVWAATSLAGTIVGHTQYVSAASFYCPAGTFRATFSGTTSGDAQPAT